VAEVGKAYERATENKEEADAMAKKVNLETYVIFFFFSSYCEQTINQLAKRTCVS